MLLLISVYAKRRKDTVACLLASLQNKTTQECSCSCLLAFMLKEAEVQLLLLIRVYAKQGYSCSCLLAFLLKTQGSSCSCLWLQGGQADGETPVGLQAAGFPHSSASSHSHGGLLARCVPPPCNSFAAIQLSSVVPCSGGSLHVHNNNRRF